jgi:hypothetical protein
MDNRQRDAEMDPGDGLERAEVGVDPPSRDPQVGAPLSPDELHDTNAGPPPLQFRLKTLFVVLSLLSVLFAVLTRVSLVWRVAVVWFALLVAAHVVANAMGTHAAASAPMRLPRTRDDEMPGADGDLRAAFAPTTQLGSRAQFGIRFGAIVLIGAAIGCAVGTALVTLHNAGRLGWPALALAACSSAGIGAFLTFLAAGCAKVAARAMRQAASHADFERLRRESSAG